MAHVEIIIEDMNGDPEGDGVVIPLGILVEMRGDMVEKAEDVTKGQVLALHLLKLLHDPKFLEFVLKQPMMKPVDLQKTSH